MRNSGLATFGGWATAPPSKALLLLEACEPAAEWLGADLFSAYLKFKRAEIKGLENLDESEICRRYAEVY